MNNACLRGCRIDRSFSSHFTVVARFLGLNATASMLLNYGSVAVDIATIFSSVSRILRIN